MKEFRMRSQPVCGVKFASQAHRTANELGVSRRRLWKFGWGFVDQAASSATNLILTIAAARVLGVSSLGVVVIGFTVYLLLLGFHRSLISQPLVVSTSTLPEDERGRGDAGALTVTLIAGTAVAALVAAIGGAAGGAAGRALLLFAPWVISTLLQDLWRAMLFRDNRGAAAAANDLVWLVVMVATLTASWLIETDWAIVAAWGLGATGGAALGFAQMRVRPSSLGAASALWRRDLWPFGRWMVGSGIAYTVSSQATVFIIGALLTPAAVGGLRVVQTIFAPLSVLIPAMGLPTLPLMARRQSEAPSAARTLALQISGALVAMTMVYVVLVGAASSDLLGLVFGQPFERYESLILAVALQQVLAAGAGGFDLLLRAKKDGRAIFMVRVITGSLGVALVAITAYEGDLLAVAWSLVAVAAAGLVVLAILALRQPVAGSVRVPGRQLGSVGMARRD